MGPVGGHPQSSTNPPVEYTAGPPGSLLGLQSVDNNQTRTKLGLTFAGPISSVFPTYARAGGAEDQGIALSDLTFCRRWA